MAARVFISSVMEGYRDFRDAAAAGAEAAGGKVLRVEDLGSTDRSSRNACLDLVEATDLFVLLIGERGGWITPSGQAVTEEEYQHAIARGKTVLVFLQEAVTRDADAARLAQNASDYVGGRFRRIFATPGELKREVERAVASVAGRFEMPQRDPSTLSEALAYRDEPREVVARLVLAPETDSELVDVLRFDDEEFVDQLHQIGHSRGVGLFRYVNRKSVTRSRGGLIITELAEHSHDPLAAISMTAEGVVLLDRSVTGRNVRGTAHEFRDAMEIVEEDVARAIARLYAAATGILEIVDPYSRHDRLLHNVGLAGIGHRKWTRDSSPKSSYGMRMYGEKNVIAYDKPRLVTRSELNSPQPLIGRTTAMLRRAERTNKSAGVLPSERNGSVTGRKKRPVDDLKSVRL